MQTETLQVAVCTLLQRSNLQHKRLRQMAEFKDSENRTWTIRLTAPLLAKIKESHAIELVNLESDPMLKLRNDPLTLVSVIYLLCQSQIEKIGTTPESFGESLPSPPDAMIEAVEAAIINFYPSGKHSHVREVLTRFNEMGAKTDQIAVMKMSSIIADQRNFDRIGKRADQEIEAALEKIFGTDTAPGTSPT